MAEPHSAAAKRSRRGGDTFSFTQISRQKTQHTEDCNAVRILISQVVKDQGPEVHQRACVRCIMDELAGGIEEEEEEEEESMAKFSVSLLPEPAMALFCKKAPNSAILCLHNNSTNT